MKLPVIIGIVIFYATMALGLVSTALDVFVWRVLP